jgi:hypothetical protein
MLFLMMGHPNFEKLLEKYIPSKDLPYIKESVKNLRLKVCKSSLLCKIILKTKLISQAFTAFERWRQGNQKKGYPGLEY